MTATPHSRWLPVPGCVNFRDMGGYPNRRGQTVRWHRLFRSDALQDIPPDAAPFVTGELDIKLVVDLRNTDEAQRDGRGPLPGMGAQYQHFPLLEERGFRPSPAAMWWSGCRSPTNGWYTTPAPGSPPR